ncbi:MAG: MTH938/NDUFAF3 family protein [Gammaproteobacteria bacterium]
MKFTKESAAGVNRINGWDDDSLRINEQVFSGPVIVSADTLRPVSLGEPGDLEEQALADALALEPEVLLLGTGERQRWPAPRLVAALAKRGIGLEVMDTLAAARTYNVLVGEERRVVAVLYPPRA